MNNYFRIANSKFKNNKKKLRVYLSGGLGNQIFQFVAGEYLAEIHGQEISIDLTSVARGHSRYDITSFELSARAESNKLVTSLRQKISVFSKAQDWRRKHSKTNLYDHGFEQNLLKFRNSKIKSISGFFQNLNYFQKKEITKFKLKAPSREFLQTQESLNTASYLSVHIRRGDFLSQSDTHGSLSAEWYLSAINQILNRETNLSVVVFLSDDTEWVKSEIIENLDLSVSYLIFGPTDLGDPAESWSLIRESSYILCANSTFSITAAALSSAKVMVPIPLTRLMNFSEILETLPPHWHRYPAIWE